MDSLPLISGGSGSKNRRSKVAGWTEFVKPYAEENKFWSKSWHDAGRPKCGPLYDGMKHARSQYSYAVRRLKRCNDIIQNDKLLESLNNNTCTNIFNEIRKLRGSQKSVSCRIDDKVDAQEISNHFAGIYSDLFNNVRNGDKLNQISNRITKNVGNHCINQLDKVNEALIESALKKMKSCKRDSVFDTVSDCYINGPPELHTHLTQLIKMFLVHGSVPDFILSCTLFPLVKDNFGDTSASGNYRAIAGGSLLLKLLDIVILIVEGDKLSFSELQFAYQRNVSTTVCSWAATSVIDYFNKKGSVVYGAAMDMSKAFDMVEWGALFEILLERNISGLFLRIMLYIYVNQCCVVKWNGKVSKQFPVSNGVRQGAISSALLFSVYIDGLIKLLEKSRIGCEIDGLYFGVFVYADDILLLSATRLGLQSMVNMCVDFTSRMNLKFGTNLDPSKFKTKCIAFAKKKRDRQNLDPIKLDGLPLPWVDKVNHLGCLLDAENSMKTDILNKRAKFVGKVNSIMQEFHFANENVMIKLLNTYTTSFYGSPLWDPFSAECEKIYRNWNVTIRNVLKLDRKTHRYLIEPLTECLHPKIMLLSRLVQFYRAQLSSPKLKVRYLMNIAAKDQRTVIGNSLSFIRRQCGIGNEEVDIFPSIVKKNMGYMQVPEDELWRVPLLKELLMIRDNVSKDLAGFSNVEVQEMIDYLCVS